MPQRGYSPVTNKVQFCACPSGATLLSVAPTGQKKCHVIFMLPSCGPDGAALQISLQVNSDVNRTDKSFAFKHVLLKASQARDSYLIIRIHRIIHAPEGQQPGNHQGPILCLPRRGNTFICCPYGANNGGIFLMLPSWGPRWGRLISIVPDKNSPGWNRRRFVFKPIKIQAAQIAYSPQ
jgi:hypothetical protein